MDLSTFIFGQGGISKNNQTQYPYYQQVTQYSEEKNGKTKYENAVYVKVLDIVNYQKFPYSETPYTFEVEVTIDG